MTGKTAHYGTPAPVIHFQSVSKSYPVYDSPRHRLRELTSLRRKPHHRKHWALQDLSFQVYPGEIFCVIGENGAGKSTLLQLVAGILEPSSGTVLTRGRVSTLLELGAGFNPDFTGRDNVYLNGAILGFSTADMNRRYRSIAEFAEIGDFIDQPVRTYSSGMVVRLAFAVAIHVDPEILLVDEALAVGDVYFRQRCMRKVHELHSAGTTILFVSHSMPDVKSLGNRALWLQDGCAREIGPTDRVVTRYLAAMAEKDSRYLGHHRAAPQLAYAAGHPPEIVETIPNIDHRHGDGRAEVLGIAVYDAAGQPVQVLTPESIVVIRITVRAKQDVARPIVGFMLRNHLGIDFAGTNTLRDGIELPPLRPGDLCTADFQLPLPILYPGHFSFSPAIADGTLASYKMCDWIDNAITVQMGHASGPVYGFVHIPSRIRVNRRLAESLSQAESAGE